MGCVEKFDSASTMFHLPWLEHLKKAKKGKGLSPLQERALAHVDSSSSEYIIGIDEVGLGCWAGPVVVAAVVVPKPWHHVTVRDSKRMSGFSREKALSEVILPGVALTCVLWGYSKDVDREGLGNIRNRLTEGCALFCRQRFPDAIVVQDGDVPVDIGGSMKNLVWLPKADAFVPAVSAASILAKVRRDNYMREVARVFDGYGFESNKGYHSLAHVRGLEELGPCPIHRMSFKPVNAYTRVASGGSW